MALTSDRAVPETGAYLAVHSAAPSRALVDSLLFLGCMAVVFFVRYVVGPSDIVNDGYNLLLGGLHVLRGESPITDFVAVPYEMLSYWHALTLWIGGLTPTADFFLSVLLIAVGTAATFLAARLMSVPAPYALICPIIIILLYPRLYNYFKIISLGLLLLAIAIYWVRNGRYAGFLLGGATALGLFVRLDIGLFACLASGLVMLLRFSSARKTFYHFVQFGLVLAPAALAILALRPLHGEVAAAPETFGGGMLVSAAMSRLRDALFPFDAPLLPLGEALTLSSLGPILRSSDALIANIIVISLYGLLLFTAAWLALFILSWAGRSLPSAGRLYARMKDDRLTMLLLAALLWMSFYGLILLVRGSWDSRLPDASPVLALTIVFGGYTAARLACGRIRLPGCTAAAVLLVTLPLVLAAYHYGLRNGQLQNFVDKGIRSPQGWLTTIADGIDTVNRLGVGSAVQFPVETPRRALARYLGICTEADDRLFLTFFMPEVPFWAGRLMAGGRMFIHPPWGPVGLSEPAGIEKLNQQDVPLIVARNIDWSAFSRSFPLTYRYINDNYTLRAVSPFGDEREGAMRFLVFVENGAGSGEYDSGFGVLPCPARA